MYFGWPRTSRKLPVPVHLSRHAVRQSHGDALKLPKRLSAFPSGNGSRGRQGTRLETGPETPILPRLLFS